MLHGIGKSCNNFNNYEGMARAHRQREALYIVHSTHITNLSSSEKLVARIKSHGGVAMEGDTARLRCEATGYPTPTITWSKNGVDVTSSYNGKAYVQGNTLVIPQVGIDDAGVYTCRATNDMGTARALTYLQVKLQSEYSTLIFMHVACVAVVVVVCGPSKQFIVSLPSY